MEQSRRAVRRQTELGREFMRMTQKPVTYIIFPAEQQRHQGKGNIVQRCGNGCRHEIGAQQSGYSQCE